MENYSIFQISISGLATSSTSNPHNTIGIWDAKLTYLDIPVPKIAGKMDVPFRISRDILKVIKFVVIIELIKLMSRSVNQVYTKIFKMPKEAKKRRFYRKLNDLNKNCESLIFHNKKEDYETVIRDTFEDTLYLHVTENKSEKLLKAYLRKAKERSEAKKRASIGPPGIYNLYVLGYPKISKYIHNDVQVKAQILKGICHCTSPGQPCVVWERLATEHQPISVMDPFGPNPPTDSCLSMDVSTQIPH
ncbi:hypothetical protein NQ317_018821 [Molorchus minor]|uniref:Uncharacterized protein n=1 Tax=Molorchus minor TaxID=1323400 RepID=A0ABQ9JR51_9CUCU|nr:hypothetical protein NQ317_018821 [Molorchus minor]